MLKTQLRVGSEAPGALRERGRVLVELVSLDGLLGQVVGDVVDELLVLVEDDESEVVGLLRVLELEVVLDLDGVGVVEVFVYVREDLV